MTNPKRLTGIVASTKMQKTIVVNTTIRNSQNPNSKTLSRNKRYLAHDPNEQSRIGDLVLIQECRPLSSKKHFKLIRIISKSKSK